MRLGVMITLSLVTTSSALAFGQFESEVPNGSEVSCAGCHERIGGGAPWNACGDELFVANDGTADNRDSVDAFAASFVWWNEAICNADSDAAGQTNGEELGDPDCVWSGGAPARTTAISTPGSAQSTSSNPTGGAEGKSVIQRNISHGVQSIQGRICRSRLLTIPTTGLAHTPSRKRAAMSVKYWNSPGLPMTVTE